MSGREAGEMHGEVSLAQGELSRSLGKARESLELGFSLCKWVLSVEGKWVPCFVREVCARRTVAGGRRQVGGDGE